MSPREPDLIAAILEDAPPLPAHVRRGPGDDAAVLARSDRGMVLSTDLSIEGRHFRLDWMTPAEAGARAVSAALSDLAAMGAEARAVLLSLAGPDPTALAEAGRGARERADEFGAPLVGGDLSAAPLLILDVTVVGATDRPWARDGARPGDGVWVTGRLGGSAAALHALRAGERPDADTLGRFVAPVPRLALVSILDGLPNSAIDLSDGLLIDAHRLADASSVRIDLHTSALPLWPGVEPGEALGSGEEYELLLTAPDVPVATRDAVAALGVALTRVGTVSEGEGVLVDGVSADPDGWDHFRELER